MIIVLTGKTASGKDTIQYKLLQKYPNLKRIITTTSRNKREGEENGKDYHFISKDEFEKKQKSQEFIEHVEYGGNLYGTYKNELLAALDHDIIWRIDPSRAANIRKLIQESFPKETAKELLKRLKVIYITVPDDEVLKRLKERNLTEEEISKRMEQDAQIWAEVKDKYDFVVENTTGKLDETIDKITYLLN